MIERYSDIVIYYIKWDTTYGYIVHLYLGPLHYCMYKNSCPFLCHELLHKNGQDFSGSFPQNTIPGVPARRPGVPKLNFLGSQLIGLFRLETRIPECPARTVDTPLKIGSTSSKMYKQCPLGGI